MPGYWHTGSLHGTVSAFVDFPLFEGAESTYTVGQVLLALVTVLLSSAFRWPLLPLRRALAIGVGFGAGRRSIARTCR